MTEVIVDRYSFDVGRSQVPSPSRLIPALPSRASSTAAGTPQPHPPETAQDDSRKSPNGRSPRPSPPVSALPPSGLPDRTRMALLTFECPRHAALVFLPPAPVAGSSSPTTSYSRSCTCLLYTSPSPRD